MQEIFKKDRKKWSSFDEQQVEYFYKCNQFFSKFYESRYFQDIVQMTYYGKVTSQSSLMLSENKRSTAIVLLKGNVLLCKKQKQSPQKKRHKKDSFREDDKKLTELLRFNETYNINSQCKVLSLHGEDAEIVYVPLLVYQAFMQKLEKEQIELAFGILNKIFKKAQNKFILELSKSKCKLKQLRINNYVYEQGTKPESVYLIIEGAVKIERPSQPLSRRGSDVVVVGSQSLIGQKDLCLPFRQQSAICCSANIKILQIPKQAFLKFAKSSLPDLKLNLQQRRSLSPKMLKKIENKPESSTESKLPSIMRFNSAKKSELQIERQIRLIQNSHVLLEMPQQRQHKIRSRRTFSQRPKDLLQQKLKFYKKLRPVQNILDLTNRLI